MRIPFQKMHGLGNDFVVIDRREHAYDLSASQLAHIGDRRFGIGCDQILMIDPPTLSNAVARYTIFNGDGSGAEHCGNGVRCVARYLRDHAGMRASVLHIEIDAAVFELSFTTDDHVRVDMGCPRFAPTSIPLNVAEQTDRYSAQIDGETREFGAVSMGNPHAVFLVDDVAAAAVARLGAGLQSNALFPASVNVGFMQVQTPASIKLRVYERGAGETLACGTGACAAVAVGRRWGLLDSRVTVELSGGLLQIDWSGDESESLWMTGPAQSVYSGIIEL